MKAANARRAKFYHSHFSILRATNLPQLKNKKKKKKRENRKNEARQRSMAHIRRTLSRNAAEPPSSNEIVARAAKW